MEARRLTREDVRRIAREEGLDEYADSLVDTVRPAWRLDPRDRAAPAAGTSKIGGAPDLAMGETWSALAPRPPAGSLLRVFADLVDNPFGPGPAHVLTTSSTSKLVRTPPPSLPAPWPAGGQWDDLDEERVRELPEAPVQPVAFLTAPEAHPVLSPEAGLSGPSAERYYAWANRLRVDGVDYNTGSHLETMPWEVHHFLGEAASVQDDVRYSGAMLFRDEAAYFGYEPDQELESVSAWQTLLGLHYDGRFGLDILDGGAYTVLIPSADVRAGS